MQLKRSTLRSKSDVKNANVKSIRLGFLDAPLKDPPPSRSRAFSDPLQKKPSSDLERALRLQYKAHFKRKLILQLSDILTSQIASNQSTKKTKRKHPKLPSINPKARNVFTPRKRLNTPQWLELSGTHLDGKPNSPRELKSPRSVISFPSPRSARRESPPSLYEYQPSQESQSSQWHKPSEQIISARSRSSSTSSTSTYSISSDSSIESIVPLEVPETQSRCSSRSSVRSQKSKSKYKKPPSPKKKQASVKDLMKCTKNIREQLFENVYQYLNGPMLFNVTVTCKVFDDKVMSPRNKEFETTKKMLEPKELEAEVNKIVIKEAQTIKSSHRVQLLKTRKFWEERLQHRQGNIFPTKLFNSI